MSGQSPKRRNQWKKPFLLFLLLSFFIHLIVLLLSGRLGHFTRDEEQSRERKLIVKLVPKEPEQKAPTEKDKEKKMQIVQQKLTNTKEPENKEADYLSLQNQRVSEQTRAQRIDDFDQKKAKPSPMTPSRPPKNKQMAEKKAKKKGLGKNALSPTKDSKEIVQNLFNSLNQELMDRTPAAPQSSATDDYLPDVKMGQETMLNTKEFKFYSYFERIRTQLKQYWKPLIYERFAQLAYNQKQAPTSSGEKITRVHVRLDNLGNITKITVLRSSGISTLDGAAVEAFERAGPFPNPPQGIVEKDGSIQLQWEFVLLVNV